MKPQIVIWIGIKRLFFLTQQHLWELMRRLLNVFKLLPKTLKSIAEFLVPFALVITVIFSYLSWREANFTRQDQNTFNQRQIEFLISQNPPQIEVMGIDVKHWDTPTEEREKVDSLEYQNKGRILTFHIRNRGLSTAKSICTVVYAFRRIDGIARERTVSNACKDGIFILQQFKDRQLDLTRSDISHLPIISESDIMKHFGSVPKHFSQYFVPGKSTNKLYSLVIKYKDIFGNTYKDDVWVYGY